MEPFRDVIRLLGEVLQGGEKMIDELVFKKAQKGDKESLAKLIEPIQTKLYKAAYIYVRNESDALDCVHDAIVKAIKNIGTVKEPGYFNTWISKIVVNTCKDFIKKNSKIINLDIQEYLSDNSYVEENFECKDELHEALKKLSDRDRELLILRYIDDKSLKDISAKKNIPLGTVKSGINRAIKKMRLCMGRVSNG